MMFKIKKLYIFIALFFCFVGARDVFAFEKFGGRVKSLMKCDTPGEIITIGSPAGGSFFYGPGAATYLFGRPKIGVWTLGLSLGTAPCKKGNKIYFRKRIIMIGTSLY